MGLSVYLFVSQHDKFIYNFFFQTKTRTKNDFSITVIYIKKTSDLLILNSKKIPFFLFKCNLKTNTKKNKTI